MQMSEALNLAVAEKRRVARTKWVRSDPWGNRDQAYVSFVFPLDATSFGYPGRGACIERTTDKGFESVGSLQRVTVGMGDMPVLKVCDFAPTAEDMLADDWIVVNEDEFSRHPKQTAA